MTPDTLLTNAIIHSGERIIKNHSVLLSKDRISAVIPNDQIPSGIKNAIDLNGDFLTPGFIDLQVNGGGDFMYNSDQSIESIRAIACAHRRYGTTGLLPTLISDNNDVMASAIEAMRQALKQKIEGVLGIHLEGPFLSKKKHGAHDQKLIRPYDDIGDEILKSLTQGKVVVTLAPEEVGTKRIKSLVDSDVIVSVGHSTASYQQTIDAINAGATGVTHLFNAMPPLGSREPGIIGAAINSASTWIGIIADGHHVHPASIQAVVNARNAVGPGGIVLVSDAMSTVGGTLGYFELNGEKIIVKEGRCVNSAGSLAGSDLNMNQAVINMCSFTSINFEEAVKMATINPARAIGVDHEIGQIKAGFIANINRLGHDYRVKGNWLNGQYMAVSQAS